MPTISQLVRKGRAPAVTNRASLACARRTERSALSTSSAIAAPPATVWAVLVDLAGYSRWNPMVVAAEGEVQGDGRASLRYRSSLGVELQFAVRITRAVPGRELRWVGRRLGIRGEHSFRLEPSGAGTQLVHGEVFTGALAGVLGFAFRRQVGSKPLNIRLLLLSWHADKAVTVELLFSGW